MPNITYEILKAGLNLQWLECVNTHLWTKNTRPPWRWTNVRME